MDIVGGGKEEDFTHTYSSPDAAFQFIPKLSINNSSSRLANSSLNHVIWSRETPKAEFKKPSKADSSSKLTNLGVNSTKQKAG